MQGASRVRKRPLCLRSLFTAIRLVVKPTQGVEYMERCATIATSYPSLINKIVPWLLTRDTDELVSQLHRSLEACHCDQSVLLIRELHIHPTLTQVPSLTVFASSISLLLYFLAIFYSTLQPTTLPNLSNIRGSLEKEKTVGVALARAITDDQARVLRSCVTWFSVIHLEPAMIFLVKVATTYPSFRFRQHILTHPHLHVMIVRRIQIVVNLARRRGALPERPALYLENCVKFLEGLLTDDNLPPAIQQHLLLQSNSRYVYDTVATMLELMDSDVIILDEAIDSKVMDSMEKLARIASFVHEILWEGVDASAGHSRPADAFVDRWARKNGAETTSGSPCKSLWGDMISARNAKQCMNYTCPHPGYAIGTGISRCAGCGVVNYCSRTCQREAWKTTKTLASGMVAPSHKQLCSHYQTLNDLWPKPFSIPKKMSSAVPSFLEHLESGMDNLLGGQAAIEATEKSLFDAVASAGKGYDVRKLKEVAMLSSMFRSTMTEFALIDGGDV